MNQGDLLGPLQGCDAAHKAHSAMEKDSIGTLIRKRALGAQLGATRANDFPCQADGYGQAGADHARSRIDLDDPERRTGIYGSVPPAGALRLQDEHQGDLWYGVGGGGVISPARVCAGA